MKKWDVTDNAIMFTIVIGVMTCAIIYFLNIFFSPTNEINKEIRLGLVEMLKTSVTLVVGVLAGRAMEKNEK
jgi:hypothetical protein